MRLLKRVMMGLKTMRVASGSLEDHVPSFEQLEPRVLLSADALMSCALPLLETPYEAAIVVELDEFDQAPNSRHSVVSEPNEQPESATVERSYGEPVGQSDGQADAQSTDLSVSQLASAAHLSQVQMLATTTISSSDSAVIQSDSQTVTLLDTTLGSIESRGPPSEIVFIDSSLNLDFRLENAVLLGVVVSVVDATQDGIEQITDTLSGYSNLSAIHIVSHGAPGQVLLRGDVLDAEMLEYYADSLAGWGESLTTEGDILLYGCSVGAGQLGSTFIEQLALITSADVAASNNPTGNVEYGADWILENVTGRIEARSSGVSEIIMDYCGILAPIVTMTEPAGTELQPVDSVRFIFDRPMDQLSFSLARDVVSFTGPQGALTVTGYSWADDSTLELTFASQAATGAYELILGPNILDQTGVALDQDGDGISGELQDDRVIAEFSINSAPDVVSSSVLEDEVLEPDVLTVTLNMSEDLDTGALGTTGATLVENFSGELYSPLTYSYDSSTDELSYEFALLGEGRYTLTLSGGTASQIMDLLGFRMIEDFTVDFSVDDDVIPYPVPLEARGPLGSLVYERGHEARAFHEVNDTDSFTVTLDSSQLATLAVSPLDPSIRSRIELFDPSDVSLGSAEAANAGDGVLLQTLPVAVEGLYRVEVSALEGAGQYEVRLELNAGLEAELVTGVANDTLATAESMAPSVMPLPDGIGERAAFVGVVDGDHDYYQISLTMGDVVSVASAHPDGDLALELYDDTGTLLALGQADDSEQNVQNRVDRFQVGATGDYYLALSSGSETSYTLLVMINAQFNVEPDDGSLLYTDSVLGFLGSSDLEDANGGTIRVALLNDGYMHADVQLGDDTYFDFDPVLVRRGEIDSVQELDAYDVVVIGDRSSHFELVTVAPALRSWVEDGGGVVGVGWLINAAGYYSGYIAEIDDIIPVNTGVNYDWQYASRAYPNLTITDGSHPVTEGISDFTVPAYTEYHAIEADVGAQLLGTVSGRPAVVVGEPGKGRGVYLSPGYSLADVYTGLRSGPSDQLFEQAVAWAAGGTDDEYQISVNAGDVLTITTATPGDGAGEPVNDLDPLLKLYDPSDALVDSDDNSAVDGRNALIDSYTAVETGVYRVRVSTVVGSGDIVLTIAGASEAAASSLAVEQASINDDEALAAYPNTIELTFDSALLLTTVAAADLIVNGGPADSVTVVDSHTLRFDISSAGPGDGLYTLVIASDTLQNLQGAVNTEFLLSFAVDATPPVVVASTIEDGQIIEPGNLTYVATFSEDLASDLLGGEDIHLIENGFGETFSATSFVYDSATDTLTVEFSALYDGVYTLTLSSGPGALRDLLGNELNGASSFPLPSGQGDLAPDDFVVDFVVDAAASQAYPVPLEAKAPLGSLIYDPFVIGTVFTSGDTDDYSVTVDANQTFTIVVVDPSETLQPAIELFDSGMTLLSSASSSIAGEPAVLQSVSATAAGMYTLRIGGQTDSTGSYRARLILNAAVEDESFGGPNNDDLASAQDLDASSIPLDAGGDRLAVIGEGAVDVYSFSLDAGQAATLTVDAEVGNIDLELYDNGGLLLAQAAANASNVDRYIQDFVPAQAGTYYARITSIGISQYHLVITRAVTFELESLPNGQDISATGQVLGYVGDSELFESEFVFAVDPGDPLILTTTTPGGGTGEPVNLLDALLELYDETGTLVATDDNSAPDGRNAALDFTVPDDGGAQRTYRAVVSSVDENPGEFTLLILGATGVQPFGAFADDPIDGMVLDVFPTTYRVDFSETFLLTSIDAADLTVDGTPANGVTVIDHDTLVFDITGLGAADGNYEAAMGADAITSLSDKPLEPFSSAFILDTAPPTVVTSSISENDIVPTGPVTYEASFSETMALGGLGPEDVLLTNTTTGQTFVPDTFNVTTDTVTVTYDDLSEGAFALQLYSGTDAFHDIAGVPLDGDQSFPLPSGDGVAGGDFTVSFIVDMDTANFPVPLEPVLPNGSLIYEGIANAWFHAGDSDTFAIDLDPAQTATLVLTPQDASIRASIELFDPSLASLGRVEAAGPGDTIYLQTLPVAAAGTYSIQVTDLEGTGSCAIDLILNAAIENELLAGPSNDTLGSAQDITGSAITLGSDRLAVLGQTDDGTYDYYAFDLVANDFATLVVDGDNDSPVTLELLDSGGAILALGMGDTDYVSQYVQNFMSPSTDTYFVRVSGDPSQDYTLVVTRDVGFDIEPNGNQDSASQGLLMVDIVLGHVGTGGGGRSLDIALLGADDLANSNDVEAKLANLGVFDSITLIDVRYTTPSLETLLTFDSVVVWTSYPLANSTQLGNNLADYVDSGGGVVIQTFATSHDSSLVPQGRWQTDGYHPITQTGMTRDRSPTLGVVAEPGHPIMADVVAFSGGSNSYRGTGSLVPDAHLIASWSNGSPLVAELTTFEGNIVLLNFFPPSSDASYYYDTWLATTDGDILMGNALTHAGGADRADFYALP
ncbi:MAG: DUF4347 domain-containing protein, partial [Phycisphaeraceae bacterium]|nr:DUF4347 domain-containing protein [Phycisphaeraceae bacterium]